MKSTIAEKPEFGNPGFKTWVYKLRFKTDIENPIIDQLYFWFTLRDQESTTTTIATKIAFHT